MILKRDQIDVKRSLPGMAHDILTVTTLPSVDFARLAFGPMKPVTPS